MSDMKLLAELILLEKGDDGGILSGVEKLVSSAKQGYKDAAARLKDKQSARKEAESEAENLRKDAAKSALQAKKNGDKEDLEAMKAAGAQHTLTTAEAISQLKGEIETFVKDFFDKFPFYGGPGGAEDILTKYQTREAALAAFKAFKGLSDRVDQLRKGFNTSLAASGKVTQDQTRRYEARGNEFIGPSAKPLPKDFVNFVKSESKFFKRLIQVNDDFNLDDISFKELMQLKIKQTDPTRVPDAAEYLNMLLLYTADEFRGHAKTIAEVGRTMDSKPAMKKVPPRK